MPLAWVLREDKILSRVSLPSLFWLCFPGRELTGSGVCTQRFGCCRKIMPVFDLSLQSRRWLHSEERLIVVSAAVSEAIAFTGLPAAAVLPRKTFACESRASVPDLPANGMIRLHSYYASYLPDDSSSRGLESEFDATVWMHIGRSLHPSARPGDSYSHSRL